MRDTVIFTVCQRPWYLREALASWSEVRGIEDWRLIFMIEPTDQTRPATAIIDEFQHPDKQLVFNASRLGVLVNPWQGFQASFTSGASFTVIGEEDLVVSDDVLEYMSWARDEFRERQDVLGAMCQMQGTFETTDPEAVALVPMFNPWVWGTWADRWQNILRDTWDKDYSSGGATDSGWDWNIAKRVMPATGTSMAVTGASRSQNIGKWAGTHAHPDHFEGTLAKTFRNHHPRCTYRLTDSMSAHMS